MFLYRGCGVSVAILLILAITPFTRAVEPVVVYDNSTTHTFGTEGQAVNGFIPFNDFVQTLAMTEEEIEREIAAGNIELRPVGDEIRLEGTQRHITRFDLILFSTESVTLDSVTLTLHAEHEESDHLPAFPAVGPALWSSTLQNVIVNGIKTVRFDVPCVEVPEMFVWLAVTENLSQKVGLATYDGTTVGENPEFLDSHYDEPMDYYYLYEPGYYYSDWATYTLGNNPEANFGAKVWAVPEPATMGALLLGGSLLCRRRRIG